ncbi:lysophospholipid acyltransferase family protein [Candidatus Pelagibacter sp.]|jgi:1-acyl-sn-glycerol-3-phosphate acyltransferase|nr:lysophospholipid acyltransferase family protein [Candidatus Pelagibacter sp.]
MLRNFLFSIIFFSGIIIISVLFLPALLLPQSVILFGGKLMGYWASFCLKIIMATSIEVIGKENILKNEKFFIAASHQSMFETFYLQTIFNSPIFILKKELLNIPIFGWYLRKIGSISIQRNKATKENLGFFDNIRKITHNSKRPLIIFPQGTRVKPDERPSFKKGAARIYDELKIPCQPIAINSGYVWPKKGNKQANRKITISILPPLNYGLNKDNFVKNLEQKIYFELNRIH